MVHMDMSTWHQQTSEPLCREHRASLSEYYTLATSGLDVVQYTGSLSYEQKSDDFKISLVTIMNGDVQYSTLLGLRIFCRHNKSL